MSASLPSCTATEVDSYWGGPQSHWALWYVALRRTEATLNRDGFTAGTTSVSDHGTKSPSDQSHTGQFPPEHLRLLAQTAAPKL